MRELSLQKIRVGSKQAVRPLSLYGLTEIYALQHAMTSAGEIFGVWLKLEDLRAGKNSSISCCLSIVAVPDIEKFSLSRLLKFMDLRLRGWQTLEALSAGKIRSNTKASFPGLQAGIKAKSIAWQITGLKPNNYIHALAGEILGSIEALPNIETDASQTVRKTARLQAILKINGGPTQKRAAKYINAYFEDIKILVGSTDQVTGPLADYSHVIKGLKTAVTTYQESLKLKLWNVGLYEARLAMQVIEADAVAVGPTTARLISEISRSGGARYLDQLSTSIQASAEKGELSKFDINRRSAAVVGAIKVELETQVSVEVKSIVETGGEFTKKFLKIAGPIGEAAMRAARFLLVVELVSAYTEDDLETFYSTLIKSIVDSAAGTAGAAAGYLLAVGVATATGVAIGAGLVLFAVVLGAVLLTFLADYFLSDLIEEWAKILARKTEKLAEKMITRVDINENGELEIMGFAKMLRSAAGIELKKDK